MLAAPRPTTPGVPARTASLHRRPTLAGAWNQPTFTRIRRGFAGAALLSVLFEALTLTGLISDRILPSAMAIGSAAGGLLVNTEFLTSVGQTLLPVVLGLLLSAALVIPFGMLVSTDVAHRYSRATIDLLRSVPGVALIPLLVLTLGQGLQMKSAIVLYVTAWPILFNTIYGIRSVDPVAIDTARSFGIGRAGIWRRVVLPSAMPFIVTGLRVAMPIGLTVAIAAEIAVGTPTGIGGFILKTSYAEFRADQVYAAVTLAGVLGFLLNWLAGEASGRLVGWDTRGKG